MRPELFPAWSDVITVSANLRTGVSLAFELAQGDAPFGKALSYYFTGGYLIETFGNALGTASVPKFYKGYWVYNNGLPFMLTSMCRKGGFAGFGHAIFASTDENIILAHEFTHVRSMINDSGPSHLFSRSSTNYWINYQSEYEVEGVWREFLYFNGYIDLYNNPLRYYSIQLLWEDFRDYMQRHYGIDLGDTPPPYYEPWW